MNSDTNYLVFIATMEIIQTIINLLTLGAVFTILDVYDRKHLF